MLRTAAAGTASLRFYGWPVSEATLSLGYFQSFHDRQSEPRLQGLPWVRRPSGGGALVHHHELTYALALPGGFGTTPLRLWLPRMHRIIVAALAELGCRDIAMIEGPGICHGNVLCFQQHTPGDVVCRGQKIVGSAQRKRHHDLMQHGSILLARSEFAPQLAGLHELIGVTLATTTVSRRRWCEKALFGRIPAGKSRMAIGLAGGKGHRSPGGGDDMRARIGTNGGRGGIAIRGGARTLLRNTLVCGGKPPGLPGLSCLASLEACRHVFATRGGRERRKRGE